MSTDSPDSDSIDATDPIDSTDPADPEPTEPTATNSESPSRGNVMLAIDINGDRFEAGLVTAKGELIDRASVPVEPDVGPESHYTALAMMVSELKDVAERHHRVRVRAVGVGCEGPGARGLEKVSPAGLTS
ncbi:MAG: hypothetical protein DRJ50_13305, partial [Actinobacteria bacterium]